MLPEFEEPWHLANSPRDGLIDELHKEVNKLHVLFGKSVRVIATRQDQDDVLFEVFDSSFKYAIVHLTWRMREEQDPSWPDTVLVKDDYELSKIIATDISDWKKNEAAPLDKTGGFVRGKKRIIIVGASSGIGKEMAAKYALEGNLVAITGRRLELLEEMERSFGGRIIIDCFDVTKGNNREHLESLVKRLGGLDILVISAGNGDTSIDLSWEIDKMTVDTNVNGFIEVANWTFNHFVKQGHGQLVTISSIAAIRGNSWAPAYSASKAFQSNYFEGLAIKAAKLKSAIAITCIEPGFVKTKMAKGNKQFWVVPVDKAARQIIKAIDKRKRKVYISRRWWIIAKLYKWLPYAILKRMG